MTPAKGNIRNNQTERVAAADLAAISALRDRRSLRRQGSRACCSRKSICKEVQVMFRWFVPVVCLLAIATTIRASDKRAQGAPELHWAWGIAQDFLDAVLGGDGPEAVGLLTPELAKSLGSVYSEDSPVTY